MKLIVPSGQARSFALSAIAHARNNELERAHAELDEAQTALNQAHELQSEIIRQEINDGLQSNVSLVMAHGQDHLMNASTIYDLACQLIAILESLHLPKDAK